MTGHLFEEPSMRSHFDVKSHLEDLAQRHPEFAEQLRYPAWSNSWGRKRRGSEQSEAGEASKQPQQEPSQQEPEPATPRGRPKDNLRNTVPDMGQKQQQEAEDKESRGQRSWSAPPDNRAQQDKPRFVSKIEITPVNPDAPQAQTGDAAKPPMAPPKPQPQSQQQPPPQSQSKSNVRHIPIFVEGRDEPVLPKNAEPEFTQSQVPPQQFSRPPPQSQFTPSHHQAPPQPQYAPSHHQAPPRKQTPPQFDQHPPQPPPQPVPEPSLPSEPEALPKVNPRDPMYQVSCVQKEVDDLKSQIDNFSTNSRADKQYILLDELLTRNLIKLDNVDTEGKEEVRAARKNAIKTIQRCISILENKVPSGDSSGKGGMDVDQAEEGVADSSVVENHMEVEPRADNAASEGEKGDGPGEASAKETSESSETQSA